MNQQSTFVIIVISLFFVGCAPSGIGFHAFVEHGSIRQTCHGSIPQTGPTGQLRWTLTLGILGSSSRANFLGLMFLADSYGTNLHRSIVVSAIRQDDFHEVHNLHFFNVTSCVKQRQVLEQILMMYCSCTCFSGPELWCHQID